MQGLPLMLVVEPRLRGQSTTAGGSPVGFLGVVLVIDPQGDFRWVAVVGLIGGVFAAAAKVTVRRLTRSEPTVRIVFYFALLAALISALPLAWVWRMPDATELGLMLLVAVFTTIGQLLLTRGYASAPATRVGPFTYFAVVFAAAYGYLFWGETVDLVFVAGAGLIALAGVMALYVRRSPESAVQSAPTDVAVAPSLQPAREAAQSSGA